MSGSGSLSDFADSFGASTRSIGSILRGCDPGSTEEADGATILSAAPAPKVARQKTATHIVLAILDSKAFWIQGFLDPKTFWIPRLSRSRDFLDSKGFLDYGFRIAKQDGSGPSRPNSGGPMASEFES
jgi:hypothetical protein